MTESTLIAVIGAAALIAGAAGTALGAWLSGRAQVKGAATTAKAAIKTSEDSAQDKLIDQLQEELHRYRDQNDQRVEKLENLVEKLQEENRGYRSFIGVQRDHMAEHQIPLPPWPKDLPR